MTDATTIRYVVLGLVGLAALGLLGLIYLAATHAPATSLAVISGPTGAGIGALTALLASTKSQPDPIVQQAVHDAHAAGAEAGKADLLDDLAALPGAKK